MGKLRHARRFRMDFRQYFDGVNDDGSVRVRIVADPDRYERITASGRPHLRDRFTNALFDEEKFFSQLVSQLKTMLRCKAAVFCGEIQRARVL